MFWLHQWAKIKTRELMYALLRCLSSTFRVYTFVVRGRT